MNLDQVLHMGGYGVYVWTAYSITFTVFAINLMSIFLEKKRIKKMLKHYLTRTH